MGPLIFSLVAVAYVLYSARARENALVGAGVLVTFNQYLPSVGVPLLNIQTLIIVLVAIALLRSPRRPPGSSRPGAPWALAVFALLMVVGYLHTLGTRIPPEYAWLYDDTQVFTTLKGKLSTLFLFYAAFKLADDEAILKKVFWGSVLGYSAECVFCFLEFLTHASKVTGHLGEKNATGAFLATYAACSVGIYLNTRNLPARWCFAALAVAAAIGTLGTRSRGGVLALGVTILLVSLVKSRLIFCGLLVLALTSQLWMPQKLLERFSMATEVTQTGEVVLADTAADRVDIWKAGFRTIPDYPFGVGFGLYRMITPGYAEGKVAAKHKDAHNEFVLVAIELGLLALAVYLGLLGAGLVRAWRVAREDPSELARGMGYGALGGLIASMVASMALSLVLRMDISGVLWILLGMSARRAAELLPATKVVPAARSHRTIDNRSQTSGTARSTGTT